jgi:hypothetical protein
MEHGKHISSFIHNKSASHVKAIMQLTLQNMERDKQQKDGNRMKRESYKGK